MKPTIYSLAAVGLLVAVLAAACSAPAPTQSAPPPAPTFAAPAPTQPAAANPPAQVQPTTGGAPALAPVCQASATCQALNAKQIMLDCQKKVPYTNVLVPQGTKFEVVDKTGNSVCVDSGQTYQGQMVLSCRGTPSMSFELKLTNAACDTSQLQTGTGQCQDGYGYDAAQNCCAPVSAGGGGTTSVTVNMAACPTPLPSNP